ncbi:uncharacterized protein LOC9633579 [Selaginella moellendorffii]|uniref:uncharacterized protein LOC9633579 n=1 Tax=Selaginella moellendorffii TaxID=88036 RepID=UPI000D1C28B3|nr:uncharacterized protein LOC9633579 [Selaginella moellendorffii]XP_024526034.1 uncharacterized protein LOC9633579 [Selaginella moellendorffii]|eukprot:XP_024526027.1 uncharacterized protein LOC9633579 [Selaginella moellendorffii]
MEESFFSQIRLEIADEYEKRNAKLAECLRSMEGVYDKQKQDFQKKQTSLEAENKELKKRLEMGFSLGPGPKSKHDGLHDGEPRRVKELESKIRELNQELQKKEELTGYRRKRDDWAKWKLEAEVKALRKKATVGWMLGSLWEVSLQGDDLGETISMVKMLRKLQKDLERESWNVTGGSTDALDKDVQVLLDNVHAVIQKSGVPVKSSKKDESSQAPTSPTAERMARIGLVMSPRSPASPASPKSPRRSVPSTSVSFAKEKEKERDGDVPNALANTLLEMHNLCEDPEVQGKGRGDIKQMLSSIDANIRALLESEKKRTTVNSDNPVGKPSSPPTKTVWKG